MTNKFQNKYRIPSTRLQTWNYGLAAPYFITVCTDHRRHFFGEIVGEKMVLSAIGKIVEEEWNRTPRLRPDMNLELDAFCAMPNHFHAIIIIGENQYNDPPQPGNKFGAQSKNLASIMRGFKSAVTAAARSIDKHFKWQTRFHDHIIRNDTEFGRIRKYIIENPKNWQKDKFFR